MNRDFLIRRAAIEWVREYAAKYGEAGVVHSAAMRQGFMYNGERITLMSQRGIFKPRQCELPLSIMTSFNGPFDDQFDMQAGVLIYHYENGGMNSSGNWGLEQLRQLNQPLIYFHGIEPGRYLVVAPALVCSNNVHNNTFGITLGDMQDLELPNLLGNLSEQQRRYRTQQMHVRLQQGEFRHMVLKAYGTRCTLCRLGHSSLLDAAHIKPYSENGPSNVNNGLALCKLHHTAYDKQFLGITPDYKIVIRRDILREEDGPTLQHSLKEMHDAKIRPPRQKKNQPNRDYLAERFALFEEIQRQYN